METVVRLGPARIHFTQIAPDNQPLAIVCVWRVFLFIAKRKGFKSEFFACISPPVPWACVEEINLGSLCPESWSCSLLLRKAGSLRIPTGRRADRRCKWSLPAASAQLLLLNQLGTATWAEWWRAWGISASLTVGGSRGREGHPIMPGSVQIRPNGAQSRHKRVRDLSHLIQPATNADSSKNFRFPPQHICLLFA